METTLRGSKRYEVDSIRTVNASLTTAYMCAGGFVGSKVSMLR